MDIALFERLAGPGGREALRRAHLRAPCEETFLADWEALRREGVERELARAAIETEILRARAAAKFPCAAEMFFTREGLEQATAEGLARHRARRFRGLGGIADLGCGIGGDTIALAERAPVWAADLDPLRLRMARANTAVSVPGRPVRFVQTDLLRPGLFSAGRNAPPRADFALFCDPARREEGRRVFSVARYAPPLAAVAGWRAAVAEERLCVKISPGVRWEEIEREPCEVEFVSWKGGLREAVLWYGGFRSTRRRATLLPAGETLTEEAPADDALAAPGRVLYEPDPSILRAGLVRQLAARLRAARIDPTIAYLTADEPAATPWARAYRVEEVLPFGLKRLREWLRARSVGRVTVKKRGSPLEPEALERDLRLRGDGSRILFLTRVAGKHSVIVAEEI
jgi:SAM-dependent methyltransferase